MTQPIRATRENLLPGTIWQNAAGSDVIRILQRGARHVIASNYTANPVSMTFDDFLKSDIWYQVQPIKESAT